MVVRVDGGPSTEHTGSEDCSHNQSKSPKPMAAVLWCGNERLLLKLMQVEWSFRLFLFCFLGRRGSVAVMSEDRRLIEKW